MGAVSVDIKLESIDNYIRLKHGEPRSLTTAESDVLRRFARVIRQAIRDRWPVDTGTSRDRWEVFTIPTAGDVAIIIENPMFYAEYVHNGLWERLIPAIWNFAKPEIIAAMRREIDKTERRLQGNTTLTIFDLLRGVA